MPVLRSRYLAIALTLTFFPLTVSAGDLHFKKNVSVGGTAVSNSQIWVKGARERSVINTPAGATITLRQCDLNRTVTVNEKTQSYLVLNDPQDEAAMKAAALMNGAPASSAGEGTITQTVTIADTGERKQLSGFTARHLKTTVQVESSAKACSQISQKYEIDGWYADLGSDQASCQPFLPPIRQANGCSDKTVFRRKGSAKPGYPLSETIALHNADATTTKIVVSSTALPAQSLDAALFDVPSGYREVSSMAELNGLAAPGTPAGAQSTLSAQPVASFAPAMSSQFNGSSAMNAGMGANGMPNSGSIPLPQAIGPKAPGKIRIGVAPADAQLGQGNNAQADYGTPIRNSIVYLMNGPAVEIAALDSRLPMQVQAEAQQKQCDYILLASVTVKHGGGNFGKFMKVGNMAASMTPVGMMAHGVGSVMAAQAASTAAAQAAAMTAQQQAVNQLTQFNGQIKSKDNVTIGYHLVPTGQSTPRLENSLIGKAKSDGEDVLTPLIQQAANTILTEVTKK
jgi:hypothetical protein